MKTSGTPYTLVVSPPHGGVWIETHIRYGDLVRGDVTPSRGGVD